MRKSVSGFLATGIAAVLIVSGSTSAQAACVGTSLCGTLTPGNAFIAADLVATSAKPAPPLAVITDPAGKLPPVLWDNNNTGRAVPTAVSRSAVPTGAAAARILPKRLPTSKAGLILNTGAVLLGIGGMLFNQNGEDAVEYVGEVAPPTTTAVPPGWRGSLVNAPTVGSATGAGLLVTLVSSTGGQPYGTAAAETTAAGGVIARLNIVNQNAASSTAQGRLSTWCDPGSGQPLVRRTATQTFPTASGGAIPGGGSRTVDVAINGTCLNPTTLAYYSVDLVPPGGSSTPTMYYHPPGDPQRPADKVGNTLPIPVTTRVECIDANGTVTAKEITQDIVLAPGASWTPPSVECPAGQVAGSGEVFGTWPNGGPRIDMIPRVDASPEVRALPSNGADVSGLTPPRLEADTRTDPQASSQWQPCAQAAAYCELDLRAETRPEILDRYRCMIGGTQVALNLCKAEGVEPQTTAPIVRLPTPTTDVNTPAPTGSSSCPPSVSFTSFITGRLVYDALICAGRFLFVPSPATYNRWTEDAAAIAGKPPVSLITDGFAYYESWNADTACIRNESCVERRYFIETSSGIVKVDVFGYLLDNTSQPWYGTLRQVVTFALWTVFVYWSVHRISASFGGKATHVD